MVGPAVVDDHPTSEALRHDGRSYGVTWLAFDAARLERSEVVLVGESPHVRPVVLHEVVKARRAVFTRRFDVRSAPHLPRRRGGAGVLTPMRRSRWSRGSVTRK